MKMHLLLLVTALLLHSTCALTTVKVCQNKDCCQRFEGRAQNLVQTMKHLVNDQVEVQATGCQSQCGKGPNVCIQNGAEQCFQHVKNAASAAAVLELADINIHSKLMAAVNVMERAEKAPTLEEKMRFLTSVIITLKKVPELSESAAIAHAYALRALLPGNDDAVEDASTATRLDPLNDKAWRALVDVHEASGNMEEAIKAWSSWSKANPKYSRKATKEIERLSNL